MTIPSTDIEACWRAGESETVEFKLWAAFPDKVALAVAAMANSAGGTVILGVADDGCVVGVPEAVDVVEERLTSFLQTALSAPVSARIGHTVLDGERVYWIRVPRTRGPEPLKRLGRVLVRRGRSSVEPSPSELQDLYNIFGFVVTEERILPDSSSADVDLRAFRRFLERQGLDTADEPQPPINADLRTRMVTEPFDGTDRLTVYGALCFGRSPQDFPPLRYAMIDLVAYQGDSRADEVILRGEATGRLDEQIERSIGWLKALGVREQYGEIRRTDAMVVPERAVREALVNAVAHRDYAITGSSVLLEVFTDRVDITSPGVLPNHMTEATVLAGAAPRARNQLIVHFLLASGFMERRGRGFPIMRKEMRAFNGTEPALCNAADGRFVRVTLRR